MSESIGEHNADQSVPAPAPNAGGVSAGTWLRQVRESAGLHIDVLAGALEVPVIMLQALAVETMRAFPMPDRILPMYEALYERVTSGQ